jgi:hypothetical protein
MTSHVRNLPRDTVAFFTKSFWAQVGAIFILGFVAVLIATL